MRYTLHCTYIMSVNIDTLTKEITTLIRSNFSAVSTRFNRGEKSSEGSFLVALSGGADSVALLRAMVMLGYKVEAVHCNFHLRGEESDRDETFCKNLCAELNVELHLAHFDTRAFASLHGVSIEMAARTLRYDYFFKLIDDLSFDYVCVAHHRDDLVETVLLNMTRGTGLEGLKGIARQNGRVVRPLLGVSRRDIESFLSCLRQNYIVDSSNLIDDVQRNKVRLNVIPELMNVNPSAVDNIQKMTSRVNDALEIVETFIEGAKQRVSISQDDEIRISIPQLNAEPGAETVLWYLLKGKDFSSSQVEQIYSFVSANDPQSGRVWTSSTHSLLIDRDAIIVQPTKSEKEQLIKIPETGVYVVDNKHKLSFSTIDKTLDFIIPKDSRFACLDADKVQFPLVVRTLNEGDYFIPFGMTGRKLVSDFLTDKKFSLFDKRRQLVVEDSTGNIVWLVGLRPDNRFRITDDTKRLLIIEQKES